MNSSKKLSIVIPSYNAENFLPELLNNLVQQIQDFEDIVEVLVIDDGSKDKTKKIGKDFSEKYTFIKIISQSNKGESGARNTGIEKSCGEYIYFLDCDDSLEEGSVKHFIETISKKSGIDLYCFGYTSTVSGELYQNFVSQKNNLTAFDRISFLKQYLSKKLQCHICSVVIKKTIISENNLLFVNGLKIGADIDFLLKLFQVIKTAYYSNRKCYIYRIRDNSIMQGYKTYSMTQYHSFEIRRDILLNAFYQEDNIKKYSNFWIENQLLSNIYYYLKSNVKDGQITNLLINDFQLLKRPIIWGNIKNYCAILLAKVLPLKALLKILK